MEGPILYVIVAHQRVILLELAHYAQVLEQQLVEQQRVEQQPEEPVVEPVTVMPLQAIRN